MKLWAYWKDNENKNHYYERELPKDGDNNVDFQDLSWKLAYKMNNGEIKDYQVELRY